MKKGKKINRRDMPEIGQSSEFNAIGKAMPLRSIPREMKLKNQPTKSKEDKGKNSK